ncbi:DoxX family membrane protein [Mesorhizobium sp. M4A.F.Ca.ET.020.02.1.1]|uniref:DoxX family membrane protein n=1 Tax=unclassified Mesorhizobium TaxID=325217 RepID=UPI000FD3BFE2|nr:MULTISPECIES: DoxX family membrane protein [unclassified Mesorhizobium]RVD30597.1 DoxX family membrane protein [Mesorhizobium sp. M4A.F.Ca.ET.020.02.1.1]RWC12223.1 MAG: DoxX family membrane protein [Mesorhizobium sp.]
MTLPDWLNLLGRLGVALYFLWSVWFNIGAREHHYAEFRRIGMPNGELFFWLGVALALAGSLLLLHGATVPYGAAMLILFTLAADALFHRYWTYSDPGEAVMHKFFLFEHAALVGGLLGLAAPFL